MIKHLLGAVLLLGVFVLCSTPSVLAIKTGPCQEGICTGMQMLYEPPVSGGTYTGPGDVVSGAVFWGSTAYCYTAAYAASHGNAFTVQRSSDSTSTTITCLSNGKTDAASLSTFCNATTCVLTELFDETGNGNNFNVQQLAWPAVVTSGIDSLPSINCGEDNSGTTGHSTGVNTTTTPVLTQPFTIAGAYQNNGGNVAQVILSDGGNINFAVDLNGTANQLCLYSGGTPSCASGATDASPHSSQAVYNGASSSIYLNGSGSPTTVNLGTLDSTGVWGVCINHNNANILQGYISEIGAWSGSVSSSLISNISARYGSI